MIPQKISRYILCNTFHAAATDRYCRVWNTAVYIFHDFLAYHFDGEEVHGTLSWLLPNRAEPPITIHGKLFILMLE